MGILDDAIREHLELKRRHGAPDDEVAKQESEALGPARRQPAGDTSYDEPSLDADAVLPPPDPGDAGSLVGDVPPPPAGFGPEPDLEDDPIDAPLADETAILDEPLHAEPSDEDGLTPPPVAEEPLSAPAPIDDLSDPDDDPLALPREPEPELIAEDDPEPLAAVDPDPLAELEPEPDPLDDPFDPPTQIAQDDATRVRPTIGIDDPSLPPEPAIPRRRDPEPEPEPPAVSADSEDVLEETPDFLQDTPEHDRLWFEQKPPRDFDFDD